MLKELLQKISSYKSQVTPQPDEIQSTAPVQETYSPETSNLLRRIKNARSLITIVVDGSESTYLSAILEVNDRDGYMVLDGLNSQTGHRALSLVKQIEVSTRLETRDIKFACKVTGIGEKNGMAYYKVPFPTSLDQQLRRKHLRISSPKGKYLKVHMHTESEDLVIGELSDLSIGGFGAHVNRETSNKVTRGKFIPKCMLYFGEEDSIQTELEIRYCEDKRYHSHPRLGGKFLNLDQNTERRIQKYITEMDRVKTRNQNSL